LPKHPEVWHVLAESSQIFPEVKLRTSSLAKKQRYFNFFPDFRYFRICQDVLERVKITVTSPRLINFVRFFETDKATSGAENNKNSANDNAYLLSLLSSFN